MDVLFYSDLLYIADLKAVFKPLIEVVKEVGVKHIVFLSVQGAEKQSYIPHHKIEKLIVESQIPYTFIRPAYFMQNFITTLGKDIDLFSIVLQLSLKSFWEGRRMYYLKNVSLIKHRIDE
ncbi:NmrA family NAD(P)-binding protein [Marivirga salinae]|uniref:NmrA family NAD(P)-binding protein n=1 Tax=Marivirga salinarum TaxID=3059078 RepID=A0AA49GEZ1_9BACT|nr:NmrA family NAD(P)-binding protein [Marivirga sp. BDSF4-3]WKK78452.1 NmrA family NAD(P)-binding protein [Marivirga sp. BDSF4-3]